MHIYIIKSKHKYHSPIYGRVDTCIVCAPDAEAALALARGIRLNGCGGTPAWGRPVYLGTCGPGPGVMYVGAGKVL